MRSEAGHENAQQERRATSAKRPAWRKPWRKPKRQLLRFDEVKGKTVEFIEMSADADFPCVEIGFEDKTALLVLVDARVTMEPEYSEWKKGNQRLLRRWPTFDCR